MSALSGWSTPAPLPKPYRCAECGREFAHWLSNMLTHAVFTDTGIYTCGPIMPVRVRMDS